MALFITTCGGIGKYQGGGTIVSFLIIPFFYLPFIFNTVFLSLCILCAYLMIPTACTHYKKDDPRQIVIDEVVGAVLLLSCLQYYSLELSIYQVLGAILIFRVFDISKIAGIKYFEMFPGATGVVADDLVAALYAYFIMYIFFL